jgi:hypothetical protein
MSVCLPLTEREKERKREREKERKREREKERKRECTNPFTGALREGLWQKVRWLSPMS